LKGVVLAELVVIVEVVVTVGAVVVAGAMVPIGVVMLDDRFPANSSRFGDPSLAS
jgi:hypothetical protein